MKKKKRRRASDADDSDDPDESGDDSGLGYYFDIGEGDGEWWGSGAAALGLEGPVRAEDLKALCKGFSPDGTPLIQNAGALDHQQAWDLTYSAPKSLSVLWSQLDQTLRSEIQNLHRRAINAALGYLAEVAVITRRGKGGRILEPALPIVAIFEDTTSRELEPQLHSHCLLLNVAGRLDGTFGTILSQPFYRHKLTAGAIYQTELAYLLRSELGLKIEKDKVAFRVAGVHEKLVDHYSTRSKQVRQKLQSKGYHSAKAAAVAALDTRKAKPESPPSFSELLRQWQSTNEQFGFTQAAAIRLIGKAGPELNLQTLEQRLVESMRELLKNESFFSEQELIRQIAQAVMEEGIATSDLINIVRAFLTTNPELVPLEGPRHDPRFTTHEIVAIERELLATIDQGRTNGSHIVKEYIVDRILDHKLPLHAALTHDERIRNSEQRNAIRKVTSSHGDVQVIEGMAGTGKTYTLNVAGQIWSKAGFRVLGMALSSAAAANLEAGANIQSDTIAMRLSQLSFDLASHHKQQFKRLLTGKRTYAYRGPRLHLDRKTIVVVDEAGMVDTRQFAEIVRRVKNAGAKLVLIGDRRQLQPIEAGGPFAAVADRTEKAELKHVVRQRIEPDDPNPTWHREAGKLIASGHVAQAMKLFSERGRLSVLDERDQAMLSLVRDWTVGGITNPTDHIVLAATREEVEALNGMCQAARFTAGAIGTVGVQIGEHSIHLGDIVLFTRNQRIIGVNNGDRGRVLGFNPLTRNMAVQLERTKRQVFIPYRNYTHVQLGYAMTTHKAQGATVPSVYVLLGGSMQNCHLTYVQLTRACESTRLYVDQYHSGPDLRHLLSQMAKSQPKQLALEHLPGTRINIKRQPDSSEPMTPGSMESSRDTEKKTRLSQPAKLPVIVRPSTSINQTEPFIPPKNAVKRKRRRKRKRKQPEQRSPEEVLCTDNTRDASTQERLVGTSSNLEAHQDPSLGEVAEQNALPNDWQAFLTEHGEPIFASFRVRDCSHVRITGTTERAAVEAAIARYGKMPGGIVVEGDARCDFPIRSLAIDPVSPSRLILNGTQRYDTGLNAEEVALLWHAILQSDYSDRDFGVLTQNEAMGIDRIWLV